MFRVPWMPLRLLALPTFTTSAPLPPALTVTGTPVVWTLTVSFPDPVFSVTLVLAGVPVTV